MLMVTSTNPVACCPVCQIASRQVHCFYTRTITDLGWADFQVQLKLHVRRFVCSNAMCPRRTFAERLGDPIKAYARRTTRCAARLQTMGLLLGGNAGALLAKRMGFPVSADTLLRLIRALQVPERATPEVLGRDDFALRKGQKYGTILVDVANHCLVDLLPDREKATVMAWMRAHAGVKVVSRDRGMTYADAAREALPEAIQVADRFHLSQNLGETLERLLRRQYPSIQELFGQADPVPDPSLPLKRWEAEKQVSQERRMAIYEHVLALDAQGHNQTEIAELLRMSRKKVRQLLKGPPQPPIYQQRSRHSRTPQGLSHATICGGRL